MTPKRRIAAAAVAALVLAPALALLGAPSAQAATNGTLDIQLTTPAGHHRAVGDELYVYNHTSSGWHDYTSVSTDSSGAASVSLPAGTWRAVSFRFGQYAASTSSSIVVKSAHTAHLNLTIAIGATVTGTLTAGGAPLSGAWVSAITSAQNIGEQVMTDANGHYAMQGLSSGSYLIQFNSRSISNTGPTANYAWSYFETSKKSPTSQSSATHLSLHQQGKTNSATAKTKISGSVTTFHTFTVHTDFNGHPSATAGIKFIGQHKADNVFAYTDSNGDLTVRLIPGKWRIGINATYDSIMSEYLTYWWEGTKGPTWSESEATWVPFSGKADESITFIDRTAVI